MSTLKGMTLEIRCQRSGCEAHEQMQLDANDRRPVREAVAEAISTGEIEPDWTWDLNEVDYVLHCGEHAAGGGLIG